MEAGCCADRAARREPREGLLNGMGIAAICLGALALAALAWVVVVAVVVARDDEDYVGEPFEADHFSEFD